MVKLVYQDGAGCSFSTVSSLCQWLYGVRNSSLDWESMLIFLGYIALPDLPSSTKVFWLNSKEKALALRRMEEAGRQLDEAITLKGIKRVLSGWHFWVYTAYYTYLNPENRLFRTQTNIGLGFSFAVKILDPI